MKQLADQMRTRVHPRGLVEEQRGQQEECHFEAGKREGHQHESEDQPARHHPGDPHAHLLRRPSPPAMARAGSGVGAHPAARIASGSGVRGAAAVHRAGPVLPDLP